MSTGGRWVSVQAGADCPQPASRGQTAKCEWCLYSCLLHHCWSVSVRGIYAEALATPVLCVCYGYALGLRNDSCRTCDDLKNHAAMLSTLQPAWDEWCVINPDPLPVKKQKKKLLNPCLKWFKTSFLLGVLHKSKHRASYILQINLSWYLLLT